MLKKNTPRYQLKRVLWAYGIVDLCLPLVTLLCVQPLFSSNAWKADYGWLGFFIGIVLVLATQILGGYSRSLERSIAKKLEVTFKAWCSSVLVLSFLAYLDYSIFSFARAVILVWIVITPIIVFLFKFFIYQKSCSASKGRTDILMLGNGYQLNEFELLRLDSQNIFIHRIEQYDEDELKDIIAKENPDFLVINLGHSADAALIKELTHLDLLGVHILALHHFMEVFLRKCYIPYDSGELGYLEQISRYSGVNYGIKRCVDVLGAFCLGVLTLPIMVYAALKIKRESPGSIIFSQKRVGAQGREFTVFKFRSMHVDAEKHGAQFAEKNDPRAYSFGAFMRKTRIDELPQLWNVFKGDMHFVGPRPERKVFTQQLEDEIPYYNERHVVAPGITGWAQVLYPYGANTEDARQKLMYDLYYIKYWSIWLEIETVVRTIGVIVGKKGW